MLKLLMKDSITHGISVSIVNNKLILDFHVIVSYGVSIVTVCDNLISSVKYKVENFTGLEIEKVNIYVEGVRVIDSGGYLKWVSIQSTLRCLQRCF